MPVRQQWHRRRQGAERSVARLRLSPADLCGDARSMVFVAGD